MFDLKGIEFSLVAHRNEWLKTPEGLLNHLLLKKIIVAGMLKSYQCSFVLYMGFEECIKWILFSSYDIVVHNFYVPCWMNAGSEAGRSEGSLHDWGILLKLIVDAIHLNWFLYNNLLY